MLKYNDMSVIYHHGKANVVADDLSRMTMESCLSMQEWSSEICPQVDLFECSMEDSPNGSFTIHHNSESSLVVKVKYKQHLDPLLMELNYSVVNKLNESLSLGGTVF